MLAVTGPQRDLEGISLVLTYFAGLSGGHFKETDVRGGVSVVPHTATVNSKF